MKKKRLAGLIALFPLAALCACGSGTSDLALSANWYRDTTNQQSVTDTYEELIYNVSFTPTAETDEFSAAYENGVYKTTLRDETMTIGGQTLAVYRYTTSLAIDVRFTMGGQTSETFHDSVLTETIFLNAYEHLRPISSTVTTTQHVPFTSSPSALEENTAWANYRYTMTTVYDEALEEASFTLQYEGEEPLNMTVDIDGDGTFLDNEQIAFALRGLDMSAAVSFRTLNPVKQAKETVAITATPTLSSEPVKFTLASAAGETSVEQTLPAYQATVAYQSTMPGQTVTFVYAAKASNPNANEYRNVLLKMEKPGLQSLGSFTYSLTRATFAEK